MFGDDCWEEKFQGSSLSLDVIVAVLEIGRASRVALSIDWLTHLRGLGAVVRRGGCCGLEVLLWSGGHSESASGETFLTASAWRRLMNWVK